MVGRALHVDDAVKLDHQARRSVYAECSRGIQRTQAPKLRSLGLCEIAHDTDRLDAVYENSVFQSSELNDYVSVCRWHVVCH
jgi:hypothetical protein